MLLIHSQLYRHIDTVAVQHMIILSGLLLAEQSDSAFIIGRVSSALYFLDSILNLITSVSVLYVFA